MTAFVRELLTIDQLMEVSLFKEHALKVKALHPDLSQKRLVHETIRRMIHNLVDDLCRTSLSYIKVSKPKTVDEVRLNGPMIDFSTEMAEKQLAAKTVLKEVFIPSPQGD
jgi:dGTPase